MTQFQQTMLATENGTMQVPTVHTEGGSTIPFAGYQLATHIYALKIMAAGMKMRGVTFTQIKKYYGLSGKSAKECIPQLEQIMLAYKERSKNN
jgi:hypothetical protein